MCGIAGIIANPSEAPPTCAVLTRMSQSLAHRGPDAAGISVDGQIGLAHARLSVVDIANGGQPMSIDGGRLRITFNGEIFNHVELRSELQACGQSFITQSDTEVILRAFDAWGFGAWSRLNGQFAFALADRDARVVWLVRDRVGICPLHVAQTPRAILFGSEARAIHASGLVRARANLSAINAVFRLWSCPGRETTFEGIESVLPGRVLRIDEQLRTREFEYAGENAVDLSASGIGSVPVNEDEIAGVLSDAVRIRLRADVRVGAYLSGGLDSSLVVRLMQECSQAELSTFSLRFVDPAFDTRFDEGESQREAASFFGTVHHELQIGPSDITGALPAAVTHAETPLVRAGPVPMYLLARFVRGNDLRVVLSGEGADEFFGGYDVFKEVKLRAFLQRSPDSLMRRALLSRLHRYVAGAGNGMWDAFFQGSSDSTDAFDSHSARWRNSEWSLRFLSEDVRDAKSNDEIRAQVAASMEDGWRCADALQRAQTIEIATFLAPYLLSSQGDRMLMAHGIEGRFPFLDPRVVAVARRLMPEQKLIGLREKAILRRVASRVLPRSIASRRKWPFRAPMQGAFFGIHAPDYVRELLSPRALANCPLIDSRTASRLCERAFGTDNALAEREQMAAFGLLTLQLWWRNCIDPVATVTEHAPSVRSSRAEFRMNRRHQSLLEITQ